MYKRSFCKAFLQKKIVQWFVCLPVKFAIPQNVIAQ